MNRRGLIGMMGVSAAASAIPGVASNATRPADTFLDLARLAPDPSIEALPVNGYSQPGVGSGLAVRTTSTSPGFDKVRDAAGRWWRMEHGPIYDMERFGIVGDGRTNDLARLQYACDEILEAGGGELRGASGKVYRLEGEALILGSNTTLNLNRSTLRQYEADTPVVSITRKTLNFGWTICDGTLEHATPQSPVARNAAGVRLSAAGITSFKGVLRNLVTQKGSRGYDCPQADGCFIWGVQFLQTTAVTYSEVAFDIQCDTARGQNTNLIFIDPYAYPQRSQFAGQKGYRFRGCVGLRMINVVAEGLGGEAFEARSVRGVIDSVHLENAKLSAIASRRSAFSWADCQVQIPYFGMYACSLSGSMGGLVVIHNLTENSDVRIGQAHEISPAVDGDMLDVLIEAGSRFWNDGFRSPRMPEFAQGHLGIERWDGRTMSASGPGAARPKLDRTSIGYCFFDASLGHRGRPIWWNGGAWVDAGGAIV